jgi:hypothetical protein
LILTIRWITPGLVDPGLSLRIFWVEITIQRVEEEHRGLAWDDREIRHLHLLLRLKNGSCSRRIMTRES